jgi:hypothetical protein
MKKQLFKLSLFALILMSFSVEGNAQVSAMPGYITGDNVNLRSDHTTQSNALMMLKRGQDVFIITSYRPSGNDNEAILRVNTDFYDENYGLKLFTLPKGKAVIVNDYDDERYSISFRNEKTGKMGYAQIDPNRLEFIGGDTWYFVEVGSKKGWVYGKYVAYY